MEEFIGGIVMLAFAIVLMATNFTILSRIEGKIDKVLKQQQQGGAARQF